MQQTDMFEETLEKKIIRMERWLGRLNKELWFLREVYNLSKRAEKIDTSKKRVEQVDMFAS